MAKINICLTFDWEGEHFKNWEDLLNVRRLIGNEIPISHFICPAYFFKKEKNKAKELILKTLFPKDEIHLHIHCYQELIEAAGITFKTDKNYYRTLSKSVLYLKNKLKFPAFLFPQISGRGVPLSVYNKSEQKKILHFSREILREEFFPHKINGFRAGGNLLNDETFTVLNELNFKFDASATSPSIYATGYSKHKNGNFLDDYGDDNGIFTKYIVDLWGGNENCSGFLKNQYYIAGYNGKEQHHLSQPFYINGIPELPENCGMSDFCTTSKTIMPTFKKLLQKAEKENNDKYLHYGCHNEGGGDYKKEFLKFVNAIQYYENNIRFLGMEEMRNHFVEKTHQKEQTNL